MQLPLGKTLLPASRGPTQAPTIPESCSFYEHHWYGPKWSYPCLPTERPLRKTTLLVVFEGESRHLFSTACILLYCNKGLVDKDIPQSGPAIHSLRGQVQDAPSNPSTLPELTVAFEVTRAPSLPMFPFRACILVLRSIHDVRRESDHVLLAHKFPLTCDTLSVSLSFIYSTELWTAPVSGMAKPTASIFWDEYISTRIVRVLTSVPIPPRTTNGSLPTEILLEIFKDTELENSWRDDLLSFAVVCRVWSCAMSLLCTRLKLLDNGKWNSSGCVLDVCALADALSKAPLLGNGFHHFTTNNFGILIGQQHFSSHHLASFTAALITILRTTNDLQYLHLGHLDLSRRDALVAVLCTLRNLHTFSIGPEEALTEGIIKRKDGTARMLDVVQLARLMKRWQALKILKLNHFHSGILGKWRFALRPPACRLMQLMITQSYVTDKDLAHLSASSAKTLERVVLDRIEGITNAGLSTFLLAISHNVVYLAIRDVALPPPRQRGGLLVGHTERALDAVIDKMLLLQELKIGGDVASELMLGRRSKVFVARNSSFSEESRVPVVVLWLEDVRRLWGFVANEHWPGWCTPDKPPSARTYLEVGRLNGNNIPWEKHSRVALWYC